MAFRPTLVPLPPLPKGPPLPLPNGPLPLSQGLPLSLRIGTPEGPVRSLPLTGRPPSEAEPVADRSRSPRHLVAGTSLDEISELSADLSRIIDHVNVERWQEQTAELMADAERTRRAAEETVERRLRERYAGKLPQSRELWLTSCGPPGSELNK